MATNESTNAQLEWIQMKKDFDASQPETAREKMLRKIRDNPFVPLGKFFFQISIFAKVILTTQFHSFYCKSTIIQGHSIKILKMTHGED